MRSTHCFAADTPATSRQAAEAILDVIGIGDWRVVIALATPAATHRSARVRPAVLQWFLRATSCIGILMNEHRIYTTPFASVYPHYVHKATRKGRTQEEVDEVICWLTGYTPDALAALLATGADFRTFFDEAPALHANAAKITGVICGVRIEDIEHPLMQKIRYLDKLVDELAKGRPMVKILRA